MLSDSFVGTSSRPSSVVVNRSSHNQRRPAHCPRVALENARGGFLSYKHQQGLCHPAIDIKDPTPGTNSLEVKLHLIFCRSGRQGYGSNSRKRHQPFRIECARSRRRKEVSLFRGTIARVSSQELRHSVMGRIESRRTTWPVRALHPRDQSSWCDAPHVLAREPGCLGRSLYIW